MEQNRYGYEEEISLRELIEALLKRWKAIALITIVCLLAAGAISFFVMEPSYESTAVIRLNDSPIGIADYSAQINNHDVLYRTISDLNLDEHEINAEKLKKMVLINQIDDTALIRITAKNSNPALAAGIANEMAVNSKGVLVPVYESMLSKTNDSIGLIQKTIKASTDELQSASQFVILKKNLVENDVLNDYLSQNGFENGNLSIELKSEEMNTRYVELQRKIFNDNTSMIQKQEEAANLQKKIDDIKQEVEGLSPLNTFSGSFVVSEAVESLSPVSPRKNLNMAIGGVLGLMLGVFWAFFKEYWENTSAGTSAKEKEKDEKKPAHIA